MDSREEICAQCGRKLPGTVMRDVWRVYRVPMSDTAAWKTVFIVLLIVSVGMFAILFLGETLLGDISRALKLFTNGTAAGCMMILPAGLALQFLLFLVQGREILVYCLDSRGAHMQTWHRSGRLRSWARLQRAHEEDAIEGDLDDMSLLSQVRSILWNDVRAVTLMPARGEIRLYSSSRLAPFTLRLPDEEYETAQRLVKKYCHKILQQQ